MKVEIITKDETIQKPNIDCVVIKIGSKKYRLVEKEGDLLIASDSGDINKLRIKL